MKRYRSSAPRPAPPQPEIFTVSIERLLPGGWGLAHADGRTFMVALAAPGDRVRVRVERRQGKVCFASITDIITPGPLRTTAPCHYYGRCGGCDFQHLRYEAQLAAKAEIVRDCLRRIAKVTPPEEITIVPAPRPFAYRTRAEWQYETTTGYLGYFQRGSQRVCNVRECIILTPAMQETLTGLRHQLAENTAVATPTEFHALAGTNEVALVPGGLPETLVRVGPYTYRGTAEGFFQSSQDLLEPLIADALGDAPGTTALDLYCGVGLFTVPLAARYAQVTGVEENPAAVALAQINLQENGQPHAATANAQVGDWLAEYAHEHTPVDFVLLDPPRTGLEPGVAEGLVKLAPRHISYVSCDPATLARDLRILLENNYRLDKITAYDLFPQTHHIETVAHLSML